MNFGAAEAARMPRMTMTTTSSISVKPASFLRREEFAGEAGAEGEGGTGIAAAFIGTPWGTMML